MLQKIRLLVAALACVPSYAWAQVPADSATFLLHKSAQRIGKETYYLTRTGEPLRLAVKRQA